MEQEYHNYIKSVVAEWNKGRMSGLFCACGLVEEFEEFTDSIRNIDRPEAVISEAGDVIFYIYAMRQVFDLKKKVKQTNISNRASRSITIRIMKMSSKHVCFSANMDVSQLEDDLNVLEAKTQKLAEEYCGKFDVLVDITNIYEANLLKLRKRYPYGRAVKYVDKNVKDENEEIKNYLHDKDINKRN